MYEALDLAPETQAGLPAPTGFHLLIAPLKAKEATAGGVLIPDKLRDQESVAAVLGVVLAMGPDAYKDAAKFPSGPWCEVGDWILFRSYSGTRIKRGPQEFRLINDDTVEAVVADPVGWSRA